METKSTTLIDPFDSDKRVNVEESVSVPWKHGIIVINPDGSNIWGPTSGYVLANLPIDSDIDTYFWYTNWDNWMIRKISTEDNSVRYAIWTSWYSRADRTTLDYNLRA